VSREVSKLLSLILRHDPGRYGIMLDANGWMPIDPLIAKVRGAGNPGFDRAALDAVVENNDKKRFTISEDGLRIRAAQGGIRSLSIFLGQQSAARPAPILDDLLAQRLPREYQSP
jgi:putative RNA 2'-phosphotransferase